METEEEYKNRRRSELLHEIQGLEDYIKNSESPVTSEWGSGTWKKRKNKQYAGHHDMRLSEMKDRLISLRNTLDKFN